MHAVEAEEVVPLDIDELDVDELNVVVWLLLIILSHRIQFLFCFAEIERKRESQDCNYVVCCLLRFK